MLFQIILASYIDLVASIDLAPGKPVPHAEELHRILVNSIMNYTDTPEESIFGYLFSAQGKGASNNTKFVENLDVNILDVDNVRKIVALAKEKYKERQGADTRRQTWTESLKSRPHLLELAMRQMQQSIYSTRERLRDTAYIRQLVHEVKSYRIALLIGSLNQIVLKMDNLVAQTRPWPYRTHMLFYLIIYEKILAGNVDVTYMVKKVFEEHNEYITIFNVATKD